MTEQADHGWKHRCAIAEAHERGLREENERLVAAYARLVDRLRDAMPRSLMALTDADIADQEQRQT